MMFEYGDTAAQAVLKENLATYVIDYFEFSDRGVLVHYKDVPYPRKGYPFPEAVASVNIVKRMLMKLLRYPIPLIVHRKRAIADIAEIGERILQPYIMRPELMSPVASELQNILNVFLTRLGIETGTAKSFARVVGTVIQYDNAYLFRLEDLFSETAPLELMINPRREVKRLASIFIEREKGAHIEQNKEHPEYHKIDHYKIVADKFRKAANMLALLLLSGKIRRAFIDAINRSNFGRLQYDDIDRYWVSLRNDYNFMGKTQKERMAGKSMPQGYTVN